MPQVIQMLLSTSNKAFYYLSFSFLPCWYIAIIFFIDWNQITFLSMQEVFSSVPGIKSFPFILEVKHQQMVDLLP